MNAKVLLKAQNFIYLVLPERILYCQADDCYTTVYTQEKTIVISQSLAKFSKLLPKEDFVRISQSLLINSNFIGEIDKKKKLIYFDNGMKFSFTVTIKKLMEMLPHAFSLQNGSEI